ncbi:MAG: undecaprenyl-diphosphatase UppP [Minisyncoccia bacterium]
MTFFDSIILGVIEGLTEFLPISSTAHLVLTAKLLGLEATEFLKSFEIAIQSGAIVAVVFLYWRTLVSKWELNKKIVAAFIPTAIIGLIFYKLVKNVLLESPLVSIYALLIGGIVLVAFEMFHKEKEGDTLELENITYKQAVSIGFFQSIAIIPGVSRAAATILGGMLIGIKRRTIVEFSFLLAIPTMAAATGLDLVKSAGQFSSADFTNLGVGFVVSFAMATVSIKFLLKFIQNHNFTSFGIYRIILALGFLFL